MSPTDLLAEYWDLAFHEGRSGKAFGTRASEVRNLLLAEVQASRVPLPAPDVEREALTAAIQRLRQDPRDLTKHECIATLVAMQPTR